jgi:type VI secretion system secreted protein VgrG
MRANRGVLVTSETRTGATAPVKDMGETVQRLTQARQQHEDLSALAVKHKAQTLDAGQADAHGTIKVQNEAIRGGPKSHENPSPEMTRPDVVVASAAGIVTTATDSTHMASTNDHAVTAGRDYSLSAGRSYHVAARGSVSLFAYQDGMRFHAAKGAVQMQAQSGPMSLASLKDLTVSSTDGKVIITAAKEVWIGAGGSYIQVNGSGIINGSPGPILEKGASWDVPGADSRNSPLPELPVPADESHFSNRIHLHDAAVFDQDLNHPWANLGYSVTDKAGNYLASGILDDSAIGTRFFTRSAQDVDVWVGSSSSWDVNEEPLNKNDSSEV